MDKGKLIFIIGAVFIVIALVLSTVSVIMMSSVLKKVNGTGQEVVAAEDEPKILPLSKTTNFELKAPVIAILKSEAASNKSMNKSIEIGFRLDIKNKKTESIIELMGINEGIIRDRISKLIETKSVEDFEGEGFTETLQKEILNLISAEFETDTIVEVYFKNNLGSSK
ncbi:MAG: hypothetical protein CVV02_13995 [Firmicutes bacterium HGW-Firmicutes-7]|nr:MAG: hypothetical protein CVV02_13995 [Firmicutes bacterium HGW-Firmicutes-7]